MMHIDEIRTSADLARVRDDWEEIYAVDPEAQFFLSWTWIERWLRGLVGQWIVLAARPGPALRPVAFFPLRRRTTRDRGGRINRELLMAGNEGADYTGLICAPGHEDTAIPAFGRYLRRVGWDTLHLKNFDASARRLDLLLSRFPAKDFEIGRAVQDVDRGEAIDNLVCPRVRLPADWELYLASLGSNTRQKARRFLRKTDSGVDGLRISDATGESLEEDLEILMRFWSAKWGPSKGGNLESIQSNCRAMVRHCFHAGALALPVLRRGETPLGALAVLIDRRKRTQLFMVGGCDTSLNNPPPGFVLHMHSIRRAIADGFAIYDFLRGDEVYKFALGGEAKRIRYVVVRARSQTQTSPDARKAVTPLPLAPGMPLPPLFGTPFENAIRTTPALPGLRLAPRPIIRD